jgi:ComEC/Rec2-related protein
LNLSLSRKISQTEAAYPALTTAAGLVLGILPFVSNPGVALRPWLAAPGALAAALGFFLLPRAAFFKLTAFLLIGAGLSVWGVFSRQGSYLKIISGQSCGASAKFEIDDPNCSKAEWMPNPGHISANVTAVRLSESEPWRPVSGRVMLHPGHSAPKIHYGDTVTASGWFMEPDPPPVPGMFDFRVYLFSKGALRVFNARAVTETVPSSQKFDLTGLTLAARDTVMERICAGMENPGRKNLVSALLFGFRQGIDWKDKRAFLISGAIHVFSVSGMHTAVLASILFAALFWLPFRAKHLLVPALIFFYVLSTGMDPAAFRAFLMIMLWSFFRALLLHTPPLNIVLASLSLLLMWNPFYIIDTGFQYSFTLVIFLVLASGALTPWLAGLHEKFSWIPASAIPRAGIFRTKTLSRILSASALALTAWLSSCGIMLYYQGVYAPFSMLVNIILSPVVWIIFVLSGLKIILPLGFTDALLGPALNWLAAFMTELCYFSVDSGVALWLPKPPVWSLVVFYIALAGFMLASRLRYFAFFALLLCAVLGFWGYRHNFEERAVWVIGGGECAAPALVALSPPEKKAWVVNVPSYGAAAAAANILLSGGVGEIDVIAMSGPLAESRAGMPYLCSMVKTLEIDQPEGKHRKKFLAELDNISAGGTAVHMIPKSEDGFSLSRPGFVAKLSPAEYNIECGQGASLIKADLRVSAGGGFSVTADAGNGPQTFETGASSVLFAKKITGKK